MNRLSLASLALSACLSSSPSKQELDEAHALIEPGQTAAEAMRILEAAAEDSCRNLNAPLSERIDMDALTDVRDATFKDLISGASWTCASNSQDCFLSGPECKTEIDMEPKIFTTYSVSSLALETILVGDSSEVRAEKKARINTMEKGVKQEEKLFAENCENGDQSRLTAITQARTNIVKMAGFEDYSKWICVESFSGQFSSDFDTVIVHP